MKKKYINMCSKDFLLVSEMAKFSTGSVAVSGHSPEMMKKNSFIFMYTFITLPHTGTGSTV